ncbi:hypothetical protein GF413_02095 [Candidatus Micrarchaeota archaeon]|nr:hypothetical protein [Candidatus Micrarchaeota archaeon]
MGNNRILRPFYDGMDARALAHMESRRSLLPGLNDGPQDAYRHILVCAELTRRLGPSIARLGMDCLEQYGRLKEDDWTPERKAMDYWNNELGYEIGENATSWEEVVSMSREKIVPSKRSVPGYAYWFENQSDWKKNPPFYSWNWPVPYWPEGPIGPVPGTDSDYRLWGPIWEGNYKDGENEFPMPFAACIASPLQLAQEKFREPFHWERIVRRDPLTIDLGLDGIQTVSVKSGAYFDYFGDGFAEETCWLGPYDAFIVMDKNNDNIINDGKELFSDQTILENGTIAENGFEALAEYDTNHDSKIDSEDKAFKLLKIWWDLDGDGLSLLSELHTLDEIGIKSIDLTFSNILSNDSSGSTKLRTSTFEWENGTIGEISEYNFEVAPMYHFPNESVEVSSEVDLLPYLQGYGILPDLHKAIAMDNGDELNNLLTQFESAVTPDVRNIIVKNINFVRANVDNIDPDSRGTNIDARELSFLESFSGESFLGSSGQNPTIEASISLKNRTA